MCEYLDVYLWGSHNICLGVISRYLNVISKMLKYTEINILDIIVEHLDITIEHIRWLSHSWTSIFLCINIFYLNIYFSISIFLLLCMWFPVIQFLIHCSIFSLLIVCILVCAIIIFFCRLDYSPLKSNLSLEW